jgi:urea transporter
MLSTPLTEFAPMTGLPALTAPFVAATWLVLLVGFIDVRFLHGPPTAPDQGESPPPSG